MITFSQNKQKREQYWASVDKIDLNPNLNGIVSEYAFHRSLDFRRLVITNLEHIPSFSSQISLTRL